MMPHFEFTGASVITTLAEGIGQSDLACKLSGGSGWPTGAGGKQFTATLGDAFSGQAEEKILCSGRSNEDITIVSRGYDGTAPQSWGPNTRIRHTISGIFAAEMSDHVWDDTRDDHSQYHNAARHAAVVHTLAMMGTGSVGTTQLVDASVNQGKLAKPSVGTPELVTGSVVAGPIPNDAVTTPLIASGAVTTPKIADANVTPAKLAASLPLGLLANPTRLTGNSSLTTGTDELDLGLDQTVTVGANRRIELCFSALGVAGGNLNDLYQVNIKEGATFLAAGNYAFNSQNFASDFINVRRVLTAPSAGAHTYEVILRRVVGTAEGQIAASPDFPAEFTVRDIGGV